MKRSEGFGVVLRETVRRAGWLTAGLLIFMTGAIGFGLLPPLLLEQIVDALTAGGDVPLSLALLYLGTLAAAGLFEAAQNVTITVFGQKVTHGLRSRMCAKLSRLPAAYFAENETGIITSRFVNDVDTVDALFTNGVISMFADACQVVSILIVIFYKSTGLGILMLIVTPLLFFMTRWFQKWMLKAQLDNRVAVGKVNNHIPETIRNLRMIHVFFRQSYLERRYDAYIQESYRAVEKSNLYDSIYSPIVIFVSSCIIAVMMVLSAMGGGMQSFFGMSVGAAVAVIAYVGKVFGPLESIGMEIENIQSAAAGVRRIQELLREEERPAVDPDVTCERLTSSGRECLRFDHVCFKYDADTPVLKDLSFTLNAGEYATLIGRTGAGKSTAFRLLMGLYRPNEGTVTVYGMRTDVIPDAEKRKLFGYVAQSFQRVPGTVADQISLFDPAITREQVETAARLVGLHDHICTLENGYDTPANGQIFSQGQFQLLSIARAVVADPAILLLDEITANLDSDTEHRVIEALKCASENRTVLSISHRLYERIGVGRQIPIGRVDP